MKPLGTLLTVRSKVLLKISSEAARKGNKLAPSWLGSYTIVEIFSNYNYTVADKHSKVRASKVFVSQVKKCFEKDVVKLTMTSELIDVPKEVHKDVALPPLF